MTKEYVSGTFSRVARLLTIRSVLLVRCVCLLWPRRLGPHYSQPVLALDYKQQLGVIDGDLPQYSAITLFNPWFRKVEIATTDCGCTVTTQGNGHVVIPPFGSKRIILTVNPTKLPLGPASEEIQLSGLCDNEPFTLNRVVQFVVVRSK